jgi:hypothetical protein
MPDELREEEEVRFLSKVLLNTQPQVGMENP